MSDQLIRDMLAAEMSNLSTRDLSLFLEGLENPEVKQGFQNWVSNSMKRYMSGRCKVCNDLRADGHEEAVGNERGLRNSYQLDHSDKGKAVRAEAAKLGPTLQLEDVKMRDILKSRMKDEKGEPLSNCRYCRFICDVVDKVFPYHKTVWQARMERGTMHGKVTLFIRKDRPLVIRCQGQEFEVDLSWKQYRVDIEVFHNNDDPRSVEVLPHCGPANEVPISSDSAESQEFLAKQYQHCLTEHEVCRASAPNPARMAKEGGDFAPTRFLRVTDDRVRIIDGCVEGEKLSWVALSHCWGGSTILTLKRDSIEAMKKDIQWTDLPPTFQNAITVTRRLGIENIWIDSLCIVQDDPNDWDREAAEMGDVYGCAALVISAGMSRTPYEPFLREREYKWHSKTVHFNPADGPPVPFRIRRRAVLATRLDQGLKEPPYTSDWATLRRPGPLYRRGWTFQETFLAIRSIHFTPGGSVFECKTHRVLEGSLPPHPSTAEDTVEEFTIARKWQMIVKAYSDRELTFSKDKLPAIAGIAAMVQKQTGDHYLAGLWLSTLVSDLLWHAMPGAEEMGIAFPIKPYPGPSWSWISISRGVVWNYYRDFEPLATIVAFNAKAKGSNLFGEIAVALLKISGRMLRCRVRWDYKADEYLVSFLRADGSRSTEQWFPSDGMLLPTNENSDIRRAKLKEPREGKDFDTEAVFLCMGKTSRQDFDHIGLILGTCTWFGEKPLKLCEQRTMVRVGAICNLPQEWYDAGEENAVLLA